MESIRKKEELKMMETMNAKEFKTMVQETL